MADVADIDLTEFETENGSPGNRCQFSREVAVLTDDQRLKLDKALASPRIQHAAIKRVLDKWGVNVSKDTVSRHRKVDGCVSCSRAAKETSND